MNIGAVTTGSLASAVWAATTRNLTSLGAGAFTPVSSINTSIANGAQLDLRPATGKWRDILAANTAQANVLMTYSLYDGVTLRNVLIGLTNTAAQLIMKGSNAFGPAINNAGTVSGTINVGGVDWNQ